MMYIFHLKQKEINSIAVGDNSSIVASGELDENPSIHIWDSVTFKNYSIIKGFHKNGVGLMCFF